jgi:serine/threonine protein kinase
LHCSETMDLRALSAATTLPSASFEAPSCERALAEGRSLGGTYRLTRRLDAGGMGTVFEAEHLRLHRKVAVKLLPPELVSRPELLDRFRLEAEIISQLEHPHIVTVLDFDVTERGEPYLVLELLHGETLEKRIDREAPLALEDVVGITTQVASALSASHRAAVVHRDLKPSNVFLVDAPGESAFVKLLDFGISKKLGARRRITRDRILVGTPEYMAPEQATGRDELVGPRSDQYALAVVAYEMLTGWQPFIHEDLRVVLGRVAGLDIPPPSSIALGVPADVDGVLARALEKDEANRFGDILEFSSEFAWAACGRRSSWSCSSETRPPPSNVRSHRAASNLAERLGQRLFVNVHTPVRGHPASPRAAFILSRIDDGMTVSDLLDVASMPGDEALSWLAQLVSCGAARLDGGTAAGTR